MSCANNSSRISLLLNLKENRFKPICKKWRAVPTIFDLEAVAFWKKRMSVLNYWENL
ncbi:hypothetical protein MHBO_004498 [Bonamia ostreae]|uniref:Uncharacterized protein n=1 Tax=Bonamia ostreae TaxID=126728 RepID=A0ABV2ATJ5_9EUKA